MMSAQKSENLLTILVIGAWITLWCAVFYGFNALSFNGYFPHFVETEISVQPDWLVALSMIRLSASKPTPLAGGSH